MIKTINDLMKLPLEEIIDNYCIIYNLECGIPYGVAAIEDANQMPAKYDLSDEPAFTAEPIIPEDYIIDYDKPILTLEKLEKILDCLGVETLND